TESLSLNDGTVDTTKAASVSLTESLSLNDGTVDTTKAASVSLSESLIIDEEIHLIGTLSIRVTTDDIPVAGSAFSITPNPLTGTGILNVTDNGPNDANGNNGEIRILSVPENDYNIMMTTIPSGYTVDINEIITSVCCDVINHVDEFELFSTTTDLSVSSPKLAKTVPNLNATQLSTLTGFSATIIDDTTSSTKTIAKSDDLPKTVRVGVNNSTGKSIAISQQSNIKYNADYSVGIDASVVQNTIKIPKYTLSTNKTLTVIIPMATSIESTSHQVISTPPITKFNPGQQIILPVESSVIPSFGGMSKLDITSKASSSSIGTFTKDWIVVEIDDGYINSPTLASSGISNELVMAIDVKSRYEEEGVGFNFGDSSNYESKPKMTILVPKPTSSEIITLASGCADIEIHTLVGGTWVSGIDTILSNTPSTVDSDFCDVVFDSEHYSQKSISSKRSSSGPGGGTGGTGTGSGSSGGGGRTGGASGGMGGFGGILGSPLAINEISYDKCNDNMARILVSSDADVPPTIKVSTAKSGVVYGTLAEIQPYEELNKFSTVDRYLYEIPISSEESFMMVSVTEEKGTTSITVQASVRLLSCEGTTVIVPVPEDMLPDVSEAAARIFDTKVQIGNATVIDAVKSEFLFVSGQDLRVSAIIDSETPLERVELRSITMGQTDSDYIGIKMDATPLYVSNSTYVVSATIPSFWIVEPGMTYWLHITDEDGSQTESIHYNIGTKPTSVSDIAVEVDMPTIKPSGSIVKPEFYLFNEDEPSYGIVSLVVDGEIVSKRSQLFGTGQTQIIFNWNVPKSDVYVEYDIQGVVELYDSKISTTPSVLATHPKTVTVSGTEMPALQLIQRDDTILADPALVYASNADSTARFTVTDPQGQCIIGSADECLVKDSTRANRGGLESISYGDQILRVRYSGADNALERFSITSIDPIVGQWSVSLESEDGYVQQAHAAEDIAVKIKYRYHSETVTVFSQ
ncbi:MAG: hypothetical protein ACW9XH_00005, partial [Candidatus Nitrosopumilus sp. bin_32a]